ncbi:MAG: diphthine--ammonia ligase [Candidatus Micrarchaeia archaeon]
MIACLFSGGKDSMLALHKAYAQGLLTELLITMESENAFSYMFHKPSIAFTTLQAEALGIKQVFYYTKGEKEKELEDLEKALVEVGASKLITGAVASTYQKSRIEAICNKHGIELLSPLWGINPEEELMELASSYDVIITQVAAEGLDESLLGKRIDKDMALRLMDLSKKFGINPLFEGGEAESFVLDAPLFKKRIKIAKAEKVWKGDYGFYDIKEAYLTEKD